MRIFGIVTEAPRTGTTGGIQTIAQGVGWCQALWGQMVPTKRGFGAPQRQAISLTAWVLHWTWPQTTSTCLTINEQTNKQNASLCSVSVSESVTWGELGWRVFTVFGEFN